MGQAKIRGSFEQRKAIAIDRNSEQRRLNDWLYVNRPFRKRRRISALTIAGCMISSGVIPIYAREELAKIRHQR